jgi:membrane-associated phospholipid phosphatase
VGFNAQKLIGPLFRPDANLIFHRRLAYAAIARISFLGCKLTSIHVHIVCLPSFHAIWAILCAAALGGFRPLCIPVALLSGLIIASTVRTGQHYFANVLAALISSALAIAFARACTRNINIVPRQLKPVESRRSVEATS